MATTPSVRWEKLQTLFSSRSPSREAHDHAQHHQDYQCEHEEGKAQLFHLDVLQRQASEDDARDEVGCQRGAHRVGRATDGQALDGLGALDVAGRQIGIDDHLQDGGRAAQHERAGQQDEETGGDGIAGHRDGRIGLRHGIYGREEVQGKAGDHHHEAPHQRALVAMTVDPARPHAAAHGIGQKPGEGDERGQRVLESLGLREEGRLERPLQLGVHRCQKAHNEEQEDHRQEGAYVVSLSVCHNGKEWGLMGRDGK